MLCKYKFFCKKLAYLLANHNDFIKYNFHYFSFVFMVLKHWRNYLKAIRKTFVLLFKKKSKTSLFSTLD